MSTEPDSLWKYMRHRQAVEVIMLRTAEEGELRPPLRYPLPSNIAYALGQ